MSRKCSGVHLWDVTWDHWQTTFTTTDWIWWLFISLFVVSLFTSQPTCSTISVSSCWYVCLCSASCCNKRSCCQTSFSHPHLICVSVNMITGVQFTFREKRSADAWNEIRNKTVALEDKLHVEVTLPSRNRTALRNHLKVTMSSPFRKESIAQLSIAQSLISSLLNFNRDLVNQTNICSTQFLLLTPGVKYLLMRKFFFLCWVETI